MSRFDRKLRRNGRTLIVGPDPGSGRTATEQLALGFREQANTTGTCPACGARLEFPGGEPARGTITRAVMAHEPGCPVTGGIESGRP